MSTDFQVTPQEQAAILALRAKQAAAAQSALGAGSGASADADSPTLDTAGKVAAVEQELAPLLAPAFGAAAPAILAGASLATQAFTVIWRMFDKHTGHSSDHATIGDATQAAIVQMHAKHPGTLDNQSNPTAMEIMPVIKVGVAQVNAQPTPVLPVKADNISKTV